MGSGPVCAMVWEGRDVVKTGRTILGATNPLASAPGTIRGDYAIVRWIPAPFTLSRYLTSIYRMLAAMSVTGLTLLSLLRKRLHYGSRRMNCKAGNKLSTAGSMKNREALKIWQIHDDDNNKGNSEIACIPQGICCILEIA